MYYLYLLMYYLYKILNKDQKMVIIFDSPGNIGKIPSHRSLILAQILYPTNMLVSIKMILRGNWVTQLASDSWF